MSSVSLNLSLKSLSRRGSHSLQVNLSPEKLYWYSRAKSYRQLSFRMLLKADDPTSRATPKVLTVLIQRAENTDYLKAMSKYGVSTRQRSLRAYLARKKVPHIVRAMSVILAWQMFLSVTVMWADPPVTDQQRSLLMRDSLKDWISLEVLVSNCSGQQRCFVVFPSREGLWTRKVYWVSRSVRKQQGFSLSRMNMELIICALERI